MVAGGGARHATQMASESMKEMKTHASHGDNTVSGLQGGDELEVAGVSTALVQHRWETTSHLNKRPGCAMK